MLQGFLYVYFVVVNTMMSFSSFFRRLQKAAVAHLYVPYHLASNRKYEKTEYTSI